MTLEWTVTILLILGCTLMLLEAFAPSFGIMGISGTTAFITSLVLMRDLETFHGLSVDPSILIACGILGVAIMGFCLYFISKAWKQKISVGAETMNGMSARVVEWSGTHGIVHVESETWQAEGPDGLQAGQTVIITDRKNLKLSVTPTQA